MSSRAAARPLHDSGTRRSNAQSSQRTPQGAIDEKPAAEEAAELPFDEVGSPTPSVRPGGMLVNRPGGKVVETDKRETAVEGALDVQRSAPAHAARSCAGAMGLRPLSEQGSDLCPIVGGGALAI